MRITRECDYALRIMTMLLKADENSVVDANTISQKQNIPSRFTVKILHKLVGAGFIKSKKGSNGGYYVAEMEKVTLLDIVEAIDGPIEVNRCVGDENKCDMDKTSCSVHHIMADINEHIVSKLKSIKLNELI